MQDLDEQTLAELDAMGFMHIVFEAYYRGVYAEERHNARRQVDIGGEG